MKRRVPFTTFRMERYLRFIEFIRIYLLRDKCQETKSRAAISFSVKLFISLRRCNGFNTFLSFNDSIFSCPLTIVSSASNILILVIIVVRLT